MDDIFPFLDGVFNHQVDEYSLHLAIDQKIVLWVEYLIDEGIKPSSSHLQTAARTGHVEIVRILLDNGAVIHDDDFDSLDEAVKHGHCDVVVLLEEYGADLHMNDDYLLYVAAEDGYLDIVKLLVDRGADIHSDDEEALLGSIRGNHLDVAKFLVRHGADPHINEDWPLILSSICGWDDFIIFFLKKGANINTGHDIQTPLGYAISNDRLSSVKLLVQKGAKMNDKLVVLAVTHSSVDVLTFLLDNGYNVNGGTLSGQPLHSAVINDNLDMVKLLLSKGATIMEDVLQTAARNDNGDIVRLLIQHGADVKNGFYQDMPPNMFEILTEKIDSDEALVLASTYGVHLAVITLVDKGRRLINEALSAAIRGRHFGVVQTLVVKGADINYADEYDGMTMVGIAIDMDNIQITQFLLEKGAILSPSNFSDIPAIKKLIRKYYRTP